MGSYQYLEHTRSIPRPRTRPSRPHSVNYAYKNDESLRSSYRKSPLPDQLKRISKLPLDFEFSERENIGYRDKNHLSRQHKFALEQLKHLRTLKPALENLYHSLLKSVNLPYMIQLVEFLSNRLDESDRIRMVKKGCPLCACTCKEVDMKDNSRRRNESNNIKKVNVGVPDDSVATLDLGKIRQVKMCVTCKCMFLADNMSLVNECLMCQNDCIPGGYGDSVQLQMKVKCIEERIPMGANVRHFPRPTSPQKPASRSASRIRQGAQSYNNQEVQTDPIITTISLKSGSEKLSIEMNSTKVCRFLLPTSKGSRSEFLNTLNNSDSKPYLYTYEDAQTDSVAIKSFDLNKALDGQVSVSSDEKELSQPGLASSQASPSRTNRAVSSMIERTELQTIDKEALCESAFLPAKEAENIFTYYKDLKQTLLKCENELFKIEIEQQEVASEEHEDMKESLEESLLKYLHILDNLLSTVQKLEPRLAVCIWRCYLGTLLQCEICLKQSVNSHKLTQRENGEVKRKDYIISSLKNKIIELQAKLKRTEDGSQKRIEELQEMNMRYQSAMNLMKNKVSLISKAAKSR